MKTEKLFGSRVLWLNMIFQFGIVRKKKILNEVLFDV